ncbi:MAG: hypothetical protein ACREPR_21240 [Brasilonema sp.]
MEKHVCPQRATWDSAQSSNRKLLGLLRYRILRETPCGVYGKPLSRTATRTCIHVYTPLRMPSLACCANAADNYSGLFT